MSARHPVATSVIIGPDDHGVVRHAIAVARASRQPFVRLNEPPTAGQLAISTPVVHWHFTDRLFGSSAAAAAERFVSPTRSIDGRHLVTLHDVPESAPTDHARRRTSAYRSVAGAAAAIVVASEHERRRLHRCGIQSSVHVVPLPIEDRQPVENDRNGQQRVIGVLGFLYPGKGHLDVVRATATLPFGIVVKALGRPSDGHDHLAAELELEAARLGRPLTITGFLPNAVLSAAMQSVDVPVVPARHVSASASLCTWIGAGRRPLVARSPYSAELAAAGDLMTLYDGRDPAALPAAIHQALAEPSSTWRHVPVPSCLTLEAVARAHISLYAGLARTQ